MSKKTLKLLCIFSATMVLIFIGVNKISAQEKNPRFKVVVMEEANGGIHQPYVDTANIWLKQLAADSNFAMDFIYDAQKITDDFLANYQLFIQLNYPPYRWSDTAKAAFEKYITEGRGGWIGFHHASLLGEFDGYAMWPWFSKFMGDIIWENYIAGFAKATVNVEDKNHPCMKNIPASFIVQKDEFYTYNQSPRANVHVLASVDESTYSPATDIKMGDHPVVWTNEHFKARNIYIFIGHHPNLFENEVYKTLFKNAVFWAAAK